LKKANTSIQPDWEGLDLYDIEKQLALLPTGRVKACQAVTRYREEMIKIVSNHPDSPTGKALLDFDEWLDTLPIRERIKAHEIYAEIRNDDSLIIIEVLQAVKDKMVPHE
jgi:hypothetical protein